MSKKSAGLILLVVIFFSSAIFFVRFKGQKTIQSQNKVVSIRVAQFADVLLYLPVYLAQDAGFFNSNGLSVSFVSTGGDDKTFAAVISGDAQFGIADPTFVPIARSKGELGRVVASIVNGVPFWGVTNNPNISEITNPKQLNGFSVATFPSPSTAFTLQERMFKTAGLTPNIRQGAFGTLLAMLSAGKADIALELEPNVSTAVKNGSRVVYSLVDLYGDFAITGVTTSEKLILSEPAIVEKFVKSIAAAEKYAYSNPNDAADFAVKRFSSIDPDVIRSAVKRLLSSKTLPPTPVISKDAWQKACQLRVDAGDLSSIDNINNSLDNSFAEKALNSND